CSQTGYGVKQCQSKGKAVLLSLGGAAGAYGFSNEAEAKDFAHMIWNLFLGGSSKTRPLDDAVLDGVDLDIEGGSSIGYTAFIQELRLLFAGDTRKQYYISAAPQCPFPDAYLGATLQSAWLDMVFVQFYNNYCGTQAYGTFNFNFDQWDEWAKSTSINKDVRIYLGVPASRTAANAGYVTAEKLGKIADELRCAYSSFGGIMMWDTSQAYGNFESAGVQYSVAAARNLKRPRNVVCGDDQGPAGEPRTQEPPAQLSPIATLTDLTTSTTAILTTTAVTATSAASASPSIAPIGPPRAPDTSVPRPEPQQHGTLCPIEGGKCQPSTSTDLVCDGYNFAICNFGKKKTGFRQTVEKKEKVANCS
ncbi:glycoside hydrolase superfamily, partial [Mortierella sp. GBAus27b]